MSFAVTVARAQLGLHAPEVLVETHLSAGLPACGIVGLPETTVRESRERVRSAILNAGFEFPHRRITINLAPADIPKDGTRFDLAIALSLLVASGQIPGDALAEFECVAELALNGELRAVHGILPAALAARAARRSLICARANCAEAALCDGLALHAPATLRDLCTSLEQRAPLPRFATETTALAAPRAAADLRDVRGQLQAKRGLEIAAAGGHHVLLVGPPGTGKTMLAARLPGLLPLLADDEALEIAVIHSVSRSRWNPAEWRTRPFRAPHHTASAPAIIGGGALPRPGEVSLAHHGVLFLDELPEFERRVLEVLREPLETRRVSIARVAGRADFPAAFQLVAAMNPCPCGLADDGTGRCRCTPEQVTRYRARVSGPLLDRIDIQLEVPREPLGASTVAANDDASTASVRSRVAQARARQYARQGRLNAQLEVAMLETHATLDPDSAVFVEHAANRFNLSLRTYHRLLKLARTIADLDQRVTISRDDLAEAFTLRRLDLRAAQAF